MEVFYLRDYYVKEALIEQSKGLGYPDFFDIKVYENEFIPALENRFNVEAPTIIAWLNSKLLYQFEVDEDNYKIKDLTQKWYRGFAPKMGLASEEDVSPELI